MTGLRGGRNGSTFWRHNLAQGAKEDMKFFLDTANLEEIRTQRLNNRMLHQRRPEVYKPLTQKWEPWNAYPDLKPFSYEAQAGKSK